MDAAWHADNEASINLFYFKLKVVARLCVSECCLLPESILKFNKEVTKSTLDVPLQPHVRAETAGLTLDILKVTTTTYLCQGLFVGEVSAGTDVKSLCCMPSLLSCCL